ncbi:replication factor C subunit 1-like isoform X2 [Carassius carassius]|uniref:replication factor C subunit 1-like isoform X2 n=1 Tax=Carassius carassius TaxID=217509 RepID=UPI0028691F4B|nr:replication factor C subunit 1-like isoform X2 [Carassius carassius]
MDIRRFFASTKPAAPKPSNGSTSTDEEQKKKQKSKTKVTSPTSDKKPSGKRKKRVIIDSDSEEEKKEEKKTKKGTKETDVTTVKKHPVTYVSDSDSDDTFMTLKKTKPKENGTAKGKKESDSGKAKQVKVSSSKSPNTVSKGGVKSSQPTISPKIGPTPPKQTPTSVMAFFGSSSVQRSDKKMVASTSTKRKAPSQETEELLSDEAIAKELQMDEDMELEKQIHDDEEFARTLAKLDEAPLLKKARVDSVSPSKSSSQAVISDTKTKKDPSPKKTPVKTSSKLAQMKRRQEEMEEQREKDRGEKQTKISPKKEPISPTSSERAATPKTSVSTGMTKSKNFSTPKSDSAPNKTSPTKPESTSPEDLEKKRVNSSAFRNYLNREGPRALGSKEIPQGAENCLEGCVFVLTGVLESIERDEAKSLIERYGGKVTGNVSRKTTYLVLGRDSGASKTEKAESFGTKIINEDELLDLIRTKPGKKSKYEIAAEAENKSSKTRTPDSRGKPTTPSKKATPQGPSPNKRSTSGGKSKPGSASKSGALGASRSEVKKSLSFDQSKRASPVSHSTPGSEGSSLLWVDKYRPRSLKNLIGQQGDQSCANKLLRWLQNWHKHHSGNTKAPSKFGKFGSKDDGSGFKAALLSGPPGVGKTTTAALVCEELGYSYVEMNASCTRSKNSLKEVIAESLNNTSIKNFYTGASQTVSSKHVLIMDEVDGMAGNEDRGGIQEMIGLIKQSKIPIICMCNDRNHQKIRSLANYCYDLRFQRPRVEQIKGAIMSIAFKEGLKIPPPALNEVILASNQDIRQVLHNLSMWSAKDKVMTYDQAKADANNAKKDMKLGPFDVCRKVFTSGEETAHMSLIDKSDLFFHDYSLAPLFVQENYLHVRPAAAGGNLKNHLVLLSKTADSICDGDLVDKQIRSRQAWSLLPTQAIYASVLPGELMRGYMSQFPTFPSWLGKFSSAGKHSRIIQELASHMSLKTLSSKEAINLDYLPYLSSAILEPLQSQGSEGASQSLKLMDDYDIIKDDVDNMMEISMWGGQPDPYSKLDSKVKAAFTRAYNKESHLMPYSLQVVKKSRKGAVDPELLGELDSESQFQEEEDNDGLTADAMVKQKKAKPAKDVKQEKPGASGKGKGRGKGKAMK